jgi:hypothetical protein
MPIYPRFLSNLFEPSNVNFVHWKPLDDDIDQRVSRLKTNSEALRGLGLDRANSFQLAATDLFVEKAQTHLTLRAYKYSFAGIVFALTCLVILGVIVYEAAKVDIAAYSTSWMLVILFALRSAGIAGFAGAAVYFCASLSRAFFHEATTLYNRRHALRFGRLFIYLKYGLSIKEYNDLFHLLKTNAVDQPPGPSAALILRDDNGPTDRDQSPVALRDYVLSYLLKDVSADELEKAFGWSLETHTGFRDMKPEKMSSNIYNRTLEVVGKLAESVARIKTAGQKE